MVFGGVLIYLLDTDDAELGAILVFVATVGALLISYARARAEAAGYKASVGLVARPERVILLALCLIDRQAALGALGPGLRDPPDCPDPDLPCLARVLAKSTPDPVR